MNTNVILAQILNGKDIMANKHINKYSTSLKLQIKG
jgi:hypothetical protein